MDDMLLFCFQKGDSRLFKLDEANKLNKLPCPKINDAHDDGVVNADYHPGLKLFVSGGPDGDKGLVKIYN